MMEAIGPLNSLVAFLGTWAAWPFYVVLMVGVAGYAAKQWVSVLRSLGEERRLTRQANHDRVADAPAQLALLETLGLEAADLKLAKERVLRDAGLTPGPARQADEAGRTVARNIDSANLNIRLAGLSVVAAAVVQTVLIPIRWFAGWQLKFFYDGYDLRRPIPGGGIEETSVPYGAALVVAVFAFVALRLFIPHRSWMAQWLVSVAVAFFFLGRL